MKVRKKPIVLESTQFVGQVLPGLSDVFELFDGKFGAICHTLEGPLKVSHGDWIMTGTRGEHWPVRNDIFQETYEVVQ